MAGEGHVLQGLIEHHAEEEESTAARNTYDKEQVARSYSVRTNRRSSSAIVFPAPPGSTACKMASSFVSYRSLLGAAEELGLADLRDMCERFIAEEQEIATFLFENLPEITRQYL